MHPSHLNSSIIGGLQGVFIRLPKEQFPIGPLTSFVTLGKLLNPSESFHTNRTIELPQEINVINHVKVPTAETIKKCKLFVSSLTFSRLPIHRIYLFLTIILHAH